MAISTMVMEPRAPTTTLEHTETTTTTINTTIRVVNNLTTAKDKVTAPADVVRALTKSLKPSVTSP